VCTRDPQLAEKVSVLRNVGQRAPGAHVALGFNERLHGVQGALLRVKLPHLERWNAGRRAHAERYREELPGELELLVERPQAPCVYHLFPVRHDERDRLSDELAREGIQSKVHYTPAAHRHPAFDSLPPASRPIELKNSEAWAQRELSLPMFAELQDPEMARICEVLSAICD
jgi:dTDP-4-amino-4,6-dideoxygalactose transaminase